jgi:hypothetical protein
MSRPIVSVAMVVCNVDRFLAEAIQSILDQSFADFEFVIVDFGSTDRSIPIISEYEAKDRRIKFHRIPHCGLAEARNACGLLAQGRYIAIMDADDVAVRDRLLWEVEFLEKHPQVGVVGGAVEWVDAAGRSLLTVSKPLTDREIQATLLNHCPFWQPTVLIRSEAFLAVGGYRGAFPVSHDYDLWLRISERFELANLQQVVLKYRVHPYQVSLRKRKQQAFICLAAQAAASARRNGQPDPLSAVDEITPAVLAGLGLSEATQQTALAWHCLSWIHIMSMAGERSAALSAAIELLRSSDCKHADKRVVADLRLAVAGLHWSERRLLPSILSACQAVMTRPATIGRPLKRLLGRLRHAASPAAAAATGPGVVGYKFREDRRR